MKVFKLNDLFVIKHNFEQAAMKTNITYFMLNYTYLLRRNKLNTEITHVGEHRTFLVEVTKRNPAADGVAPAEP